MKHLFDVDIASQYGVNAAILLENIGFWVKQNEANEVKSPSSRRAWVEITLWTIPAANPIVALLAEGVGRNCKWEFC